MNEQGNRPTKTDSAGTTYYIYNDANELLSVSSEQGAVSSYTYDDNGNLTMKNSSTEGLTTYSYDNKNQLVKVVKPNGDIIEYTYDGEGKRYSKTVNGNTKYYHYDAEGNIVSESNSNKEVLVKYIRDNSGKALSMIQYAEPGTPNPEPTTYYFIYNAHGDVTALTDSSGNVVATYTYDEFGNQLSINNQPSTNNEQGIYNPLRYSGANNAYYDSETSLYKMGIRYYNPGVGRWLTRDNYEGEQGKTQGRNKYVYVENSPLAKVDPTGLKAWPTRSDKWPWTYSYWQLRYRKYTRKRSVQLRNQRKRYDCADFAMKVLMDFASAYKLRLKLNHGGTWIDSNNYSSKDSFWRAIKPIRAWEVGMLNTYKIPFIRARAGDILSQNFNTGRGGMWDTKVIYANHYKPKKFKNRYFKVFKGNLMNGEPQPVAGPINIYWSEVKYGDYYEHAPRRWKSFK